MKRLSCVIDDELNKKLKEIAEKDKRSVSFIVKTLLERAIKERNRKKINTKE